MKIKLSYKKDFKIAVYTANIGNNIEVKDLKVTEPNIDYFYFTDKPIKLKKWKIQYIQNTYENTKISSKNRILAKRIKMLFWERLKEYDWVVWVDAECLPNFSIGLREYIEKIPSNIDVCFNTHPDRECTYNEIDTVKKYNLDDAQQLDQWEKKLIKEKFPKNYGLSDSCKIIWRYNFRNIPRKKIEKWFNLSTNKFRRDQITLNYLIWKYNIKKYTLNIDLNEIIKTIKVNKTSTGARERKNGGWRI